MSNPFARSAYASPSAGSAPSIANAPGGVSGASKLNFASTKSELSDAMAGRISLAILNAFVLFLVVFYLWTRRVQAGA